MSQHKSSATPVQDIIYLILGVLSASFALRSFLVPNHFLDGGITGISLLLHEVFHWHLGLVIVLINIPLIIMGMYQIGKHFAIRTMLAVIAIAICLQYMPFPEITHDKLLVAIFGGFFLGLGIGLSMRGGGAIDGIEVLALFTLKRSSLSITEIILGLNVVIFLIAAFYLQLEVALYAMLTYYIAGQTTKYVIEGIEAYTGVTIISAESDKIKAAMVLALGRGITIYKGERGFMKDSFEVSADCDIVFTVVTRLEVRKLRKLVAEIDSKAFVFTHTINESSGGILKKIVKH
ncbi:YitT family protein [Taibaiella lutea]|uniref:YitT family protein n=1 Tax=Taibaiella lutea TaxID=2608001 RepID=A0A5M6CNU3_9BACT|nr:YitT family protein [Taibaiella lutea]KAA5534819.1 YitT family protein [Taibaiella lutea]